MAQHGDAQARRRAGGATSQRAICDLPQPVRTAETAITGRSARSMVRAGPEQDEVGAGGERARARGA